MKAGAAQDWAIELDWATGAGVQNDMTPQPIQLSHNHDCMSRRIQACLLLSTLFRWRRPALNRCPMSLIEISALTAPLHRQPGNRRQRLIETKAKG
jgi:hypothetical protein